MGLIERHLWVIRHAKSADGRADFERELNPRGARNAVTMGDWLSRHKHTPEWIWASTARRALTTAEAIATACNVQCLEQDELYLASADVLLDCLRATPPDIHRTAVVAHNPGLTYLANQLGKSPVTDNLVTLGCALFRFQGDWGDLGWQRARFVELAEPRAIEGED